jgi:serine phosphatase RsbU (regulator of sigma subunit)
MSNYKSIFFLLILIISNQFYCQNDQIKDLKLRLLNHKNEDTLKVLIYKDLSFYFHYMDPDTGIYYAEKGISLAEKLNWTKGLASCYNSMGVNYNDLTEYSKALDAHTKALKLREEIGEPKAIAVSLGNIGLIYEGLANYPVALEYQLKALKYFQKLNDKKLIILSYTNIGNIYDKTGEKKLSLDYHKKAKFLANQIKDKELLVLVNSNIGNCFLKLNQLDSAEHYQKKGIELALITGNKKAILNGYGNIGVIAEQKGDFSKALDQQEKCLAVALEINDLYSEAIAKNNIAKLNYNLKNYENAEKNGLSALKLSTQINALDVMKDSHKILSEIFDKTNNEKSYYHFKEYIKLRDSIFSEENAKIITTKELKFAFEREMETRKQEDEKQKSLSKLELNKQKQIRYVFTGALIIAIILLFFVYRNYIEKSKINKELALKNITIEHQKREITDSINYAKRIQNAILPNLNDIRINKENFFVLYKPKDIVSGDFYFYKKQENSILIACADCTGHGVPGAFMSMIGMKELQIASETHAQPSLILNALNLGIKNTLKQNEADATKDGMDIALCKIEKNKITYSGANRPLWLLKNGSKEIIEIKATKTAIGGYTNNDQLFDQHTIECNPGDSIYIMSDGYADQFGGEKGKKLTTKKLKEFIIQHGSDTMENQYKFLNEFMHNWKSNYEQIDDLLVIGYKFH